MEYSQFEEGSKRIQLGSKWHIILRSLIDIRIASNYYSIKNHLSGAKGKILDIGCGNSPYKFLLGKDATYYGIDSKLSSAFSFNNQENVIFYEGDTFPVQDNYFDLVFHTEVLEHISEPIKFLEECERVLKKDGTLIFIVPFSYRYHYIPYDYYRYTPSILKKILKDAGFKEIIITNQGTDITVVCHKFICIFFRLLTQQQNFLFKIFNIFIVLICLPLLSLAHVVGMLTLLLNIGSNADTLGYLVKAKKPF